MAKVTKLEICYHTIVNPQLTQEKMDNKKNSISSRNSCRLSQTDLFHSGNID